MESELAVPVIPLSQVGGGNGARYLAVGPIPSLQVAAGQQGHCMVPVGGQHMVGGPSLSVLVIPLSQPPTSTQFLRLRGGGGHALAGGALVKL